MLIAQTPANKPKTPYGTSMTPPPQGPMRVPPPGGGGGVGMTPPPPEPMRLPNSGGGVGMTPPPPEPMRLPTAPAPRPPAPRPVQAGPSGGSPADVGGGAFKGITDPLEMLRAVYKRGGTHGDSRNDPRSMLGSMSEQEFMADPRQMDLARAAISGATEQDRVSALERIGLGKRPAGPQKMIPPPPEPMRAPVSMTPPPPEPMRVPTSTSPAEPPPAAPTGMLSAAQTPSFGFGFGGGGDSAGYAALQAPSALNPNLGQRNPPQLGSALAALRRVF